MKSPRRETVRVNIFMVGGRMGSVEGATKSQLKAAPPQIAEVARIKVGAEQ